MRLDTSAGKALAVKSKESKYTLLFDASWTEWMMRCFKLSPRPPSKIAASTALPNLVKPRGSRVKIQIRNMSYYISIINAKNKQHIQRPSGSNHFKYLTTKQGNCGATNLMAGALRIFVKIHLFDLGFIFFGKGTHQLFFPFCLLASLLLTQSNGWKQFASQLIVLARCEAMLATLKG